MDAGIKARKRLKAAAIVTLVCGGLTMLAGSPAAADPFGQPQPNPNLPPITTACPHGCASPWQQLPHGPGFPGNSIFGPGSMLLMSDGSVLVHQDDTRTWKRLVPDRHGSYVHGRWQRVASLPPGYAPLYFTSAVLPDGRLVIMGGEYDGGNDQVETNRGAIYDPVKNAWRVVPPPAGWGSIGDAQSTVMADGRLLMADPEGFDDAILDARTLTWSPTGTGKLDENTEEGFSLLPDGRILTVDSDNRGSELFDPRTGRWTSAGRIPVQLIDSQSEQGPLVSGPDGRVLAIGATGHTAIYHSVRGRPGRWTAGPNIPRELGRRMVAADAAAARLPNGNVLLDASPPGQTVPVQFFIFDGRTVRNVADNGGYRNESSYNTRMLVLPTGQILYDDTEHIYVFHPGGAPKSAWRPSITAVPPRLARSGSYTLSGRQLAGRDQGAAYGDDFQDNTNYPLVRILNVASGTVTYARTSGWTSDSTAPGAASSTGFTLPRGIPLGRSRLVVVANGIASKPVVVTVTR